MKEAIIANLKGMQEYIGQVIAEIEAKEEQDEYLDYLEGFGQHVAELKDSIETELKENHQGN